MLFKNSRFYIKRKEIVVFRLNSPKFFKFSPFAPIQWVFIFFPLDSPACTDSGELRPLRQGEFHFQRGV
ncbi:MAG: hypothetical protein MJY98_12760, partial [Fibrobacter sp.]|nr:hypothetical protein [Fibrobacter sp.]